MESTFLVLVVSHAFIGLRSIILDLHPSERVMAWIDRALVLVGAGAVIYGIWLLRLIASRA